MEFERLVAEAIGAPLKGWDFGWLAGRVEGSDPSWSYPLLAGELVRSGSRLLDVDTGGGELLSSLAPLPAGAVATEGWEPNLASARERLGPLGVDVRFGRGDGLPVADRSVDVVLNRHGRLDAGEVARVLAPGGALLTQQVGSDDCAEINAALGAPAAYGRSWNAGGAVAELGAVGMGVIDVREEWPSLTFYDIGALVYQLRAVAWQVPDFTVSRYEEGLRRIDRHIRESGEFRVRAHRFLVRAERSA
ncbi:class I SAM-dependent methyltransferase [Paractinoplanes atraurantiacus]|uniref:Methyltransferase domain-containing protein n=1 Tax=Paractinoplanes atraurantiacus TaxID=1036182 RepID=A0A285KJQ5_9ACTN|nr:methyltransferase domain-containing protein [Actinoplanes atraurantiacus]SNY71666.1 Methyltransferase domain-containing protein [Actinoplanes atraurantiacus]